MNINSFLLTDFYKVGHVFQYPPGTERVYSNLTPRKSRIFGVDHMVFFGLQYFIHQYLVEHFNRNFFYRSLESVMEEYRDHVESSLGGPLPSYEHIEAIHRMGFLPIEIKALPEGTLVPMRVPCMTVANTVPEHAWLTNWVESLLSTSIWQPCTSATIAHEYRKLLDRYAAETGMDPGFAQWQGHDFSLRGMSSLESAVTSGMGHLLSFTGTDTIPAISALQKYYSGTGLIGGSVAATEHSVMCAGEQDSELETFRRLIEDVYPSGIVSIVSDTWDLWKVLNEYMPALRSKIMARNGKVVIRPDSGDPVNIICGDDESSNRLERMGVVELLWQHFGGTRTSTGHKLLDSHVGAIYGDSITLERAKQICEGLKRKGFASQVVFGIGSYTYQYNTRDTFGTAMKATSVTINGQRRSISKNPMTDDGTKKSAAGLLYVGERDGELYLEEDVTSEREKEGLLKTVFRNGMMSEWQTLHGIRERLEKARARR